MSLQVPLKLLKEVPTLQETFHKKEISEILIRTFLCCMSLIHKRKTMSSCISNMWKLASQYITSYSTYSSASLHFIFMSSAPNGHRF